jgi:hypothetical protein
MSLKIAISIISILILFNSCDYRTPSKDRFENITKIELTDSINVIQDRFEDSGPDYGLFYKFTLNDINCLDLKSKIERSKDWVKKGNEWTFYKTVNGTIYNITFSIEKCQISYNEDLI